MVSTCTCSDQARLVLAIGQMRMVRCYTKAVKGDHGIVLGGTGLLRLNRSRFLIPVHVYE